MGIQIGIHPTPGNVRPPVDCGVNETFYAKMNKDGRITIPKINAELIKTQLHKEEPLNE